MSEKTKRTKKTKSKPEAVKVILCTWKEFYVLEQGGFELFILNDDALVWHVDMILGLSSEESDRLIENLKRNGKVEVAS